MERRLHDAAIAGNTSSLQLILLDDPLILDRFLAESFLETPLHIAAMLGHLDFAEQILRVKPELVVELDSRRSTALHLASAKGYVEMVKLLVNENPGMCNVRDRYGRNPVHVAAIKGQVGVLKELVQARLDAAQSPTERGDHFFTFV